MLAYLKDSGYAEEPAWLAEKLAEVDDIAPLVTNIALDEETVCAICESTVGMFVSILSATSEGPARELTSFRTHAILPGIPAERGAFCSLHSSLRPRRP